MLNWVVPQHISLSTRFEQVLTAFEAVEKLLTTAQVALFLENQFIDTRETAATFDCFGYHPDFQKPQT